MFLLYLFLLLGHYNKCEMTSYIPEGSNHTCTYNCDVTEGHMTSVRMRMLKDVHRKEVHLCEISLIGP